MSELYPDTTVVSGLFGTTVGPVPLGVLGSFPAWAGEGRTYWRLGKSMIVPTSFEVFKDGDLTFGVRAGRFLDGSTVRDVASASAQAMVNNATNYIYIVPAGTITVNQTGFPSQAATPHIPLATIACGTASIAGTSGKYDFDDITDCRGRAIFSMPTGVSPAALQDGIPTATITAGTETANKRVISVQVKDAAGNNLAQKRLVRIWFASSDFGASSATSNTIGSVTAGTLQRTIEANAEIMVITDATGLASVELTVAGTTTRYAMAALGERIDSSGAIAYD